MPCERHPLKMVRLPISPFPLSLSFPPACYRQAKAGILKYQKNISVQEKSGNFALRVFGSKRRRPFPLSLPFPLILKKFKSANAVYPATGGTIPALKNYKFSNQVNDNKDYSNYPILNIIEKHKKRP
jgi:hypothetical protein